MFISSASRRPAPRSYWNICRRC